MTDEEHKRLKDENDNLRRMLFPYADAKEISGLSWTGFYVIGDRKSIREVSNALHRSQQLEEYQKAFLEEKERLMKKIEKLQDTLAFHNDKYA